MADSANLVTNIMFNGFKNIVLTASLVSDGSGLSNYTLVDATSAGPYGVTKGGQTFYPGVNMVLHGIDYDIQNMQVALAWKATVNQNLLVLGNAPGNFDWRRFGGQQVPSGLAGATGSLLISTSNQAVGASFFMTLYLWKGVPQS